MHVVVLGEGLAPVLAAMWLRKLSSTVDITLLSGEGALGHSAPLVPLYALGVLRREELYPVPQSYVSDVVRAKVVTSGYELNLRERVVRIEGEAVRFDYLIVAVEPECSAPRGLPESRVACPWRLAEAHRVREELSAASRVALVGDALMSLALARHLADRGYDCVVVVDEAASGDRDIIEEAARACSGVCLSEEVADAREAELVLCSGLWRAPRRLSELGVRTGRFGALVDGRGVTSVEGVLAVGGCAEHVESYGDPYIPVSEGVHDAECLVAAASALRPELGLRLPRVAGCLCFELEGGYVVSVGSTAAEARRRGLDAISVRLRRKVDGGEAVVKVVVDRRSGVVVGVHVVATGEVDLACAAYACLTAHVPLRVENLAACPQPTLLGRPLLREGLLEALRSAWYKSARLGAPR